MFLRRVARMCLTAAAVGQLVPLAAQMPTAVREPTFEVSVVRLSSADAQNSTLNLGKDRVRAQNLTLQSLVQFAYKLSSGSDDQIVGGPKWMKSTRFDLEGKLDVDLHTA